MKILMFSPSVKTSYISGNILVFRKLEKNKPKQSELCLVLNLGQFASLGRSVSFKEASDHPTTFTKLNVLPQVFLSLIIGKMVTNRKTQKNMCFFAFSENFIIRFSGNEFSQDCYDHYSVKCHFREKV